MVVVVVVVVVHGDAASDPTYSTSNKDRRCIVLARSFFYLKGSLEGAYELSICDKMLMSISYVYPY
jgi:putative SOS response-associated peptidase YedK